jgi:hypothetical protein
VNLKEFVAETLQQIMEGVTLAKSQDGRVAVVPEITSSLGGSMSVISPPRPVYTVEFDVAVTVSKKLEGELKGHLAVVGGSASDVREDSKVSRVKFSVPLDLTAPPSKVLTAKP